MKQWFVLCQLAAVSGLDYWLSRSDLSNAFYANLFGGGLPGVVLADQFGYGQGTNLFNTYVLGHSLSDPAAANVLLTSTLVGNNLPYQYNNAVGTYLSANALQDSPTNFVLASALTPQQQFGGNAFLAASLANTFGGGIGGAYLANEITGYNSIGRPMSGGGGMGFGGGGMGFGGNYYGNAYYTAPPVYTAPVYSAPVYSPPVYSPPAYSTGCFIGGVWQPYCY
jgi:hypothetical protein